MGKSVRLQAREVGCRTARVGGVYSLGGDDGERWAAGCWRCEDDEHSTRKTVCDKGSAPSNLQPCEHGRLVAFGRKRWVLVGGNDEVHQDEDPGCAGRRLELGQTSPGHSEYFECLLYCDYILSSSMHMVMVGHC